MNFFKALGSFFGEGFYEDFKEGWNETKPVIADSRELNSSTNTFDNCIPEPMDTMDMSHRTFYPNMYDDYDD